MQLAEDINDEDSVSAVKYNEDQRRAKVCKEEAEQRAWEAVELMAQEEVEQSAEVERHKAKE